MQEHGGRAALGLNGLPDDSGMVDVEVRHVQRVELGEAGVGKGLLLAREPLQRAVRPDMDEEVGAEDVAHPAVEGDVVVRADDIRAVVDRLGVLLVAARWLQADEDLAVDDPRHRHSPLDDLELPRRLAPAVYEALLHLGSQCLVPLLIALHGDAVHGTAHHFARLEPRAVVGHRTDDLLDDGVAVGVVLGQLYALGA